METSLKTGFAQVFYCCPKNLSCPNFGGAAAPLAPPARTPMHVELNKINWEQDLSYNTLSATVKTRDLDRHFPKLA